MAGRRAWRRTRLAPLCEEGQIPPYYNRLCSPLNLLHTARFAAFGALSERLSPLPAQVRHSQHLLLPRVGKRICILSETPSSLVVRDVAFRLTWPRSRTATASQTETT